MLRPFISLFLILLLTSCGRGLLDGDINKNMAELDKLYGVCDNPYRNYNKSQRLVCESQERAAGRDGEFKSPLNLTKLFENNQSGGNVIYASSVNNYLWSASVSILEPYSLDTVDSQGGVITTNWIMEKSEKNKRCQIKINIRSKELLSSGVKVKVICENQEADNWYGDQISYADEEKKLTLKILEIANELKLNEELSR